MYAVKYVRQCGLWGQRGLFTTQKALGADLNNFKAVNDPMRDFLPGSDDHERLLKRVTYYHENCSDVPVVIGDEEFHTNDVRYQVMPFDHQRKVAKYSYADKSLVQKAIDTSVKAQRDWERQPFEKRAEIFLKAAEMMQDDYRMDLLATTMLGQAKTIVQAEIDAACELIDFLNFNVQFGYNATQYQPISVGTIKNSMSYRGMEGFWAAISPFNFTAIGGNLSSAPALAGNCVVWKPSDTALLSNYTVYKIFREAGLPGGVINFVPSDGPTFGDTITSSPELAGINFTGSVGTFERLWGQVGKNITNFRGYPRMIGECGGKNFHLVHSSADVESVVNGTLRSAFEYSGQKCSACSKIYLPQSNAEESVSKILNAVSEMKMGSPLDNDTFLTTVIDEKSFDRISVYLENASKSSTCKILVGGKGDKSKGYFIPPTVIMCEDRNDPLLSDELFGPVLAVHVYDEKDTDNLLHEINSSRYALTGAIFAQDQSVLDKWTDFFRFSAGNFYVNDKSTGSVVAQQPFGGARKSGTNDKAGGPHYMLKFMSPLSIKENTGKLTEWKYPYMEA